MNFDHINVTVEKPHRKGQLYLFPPEQTPESILAERLQHFYKKNCYWIIRKYKHNQVLYAFDELEKKGDTDFTHLMQKLHHG